jgi:hypothetical protein
MSSSNGQFRPKTDTLSHRTTVTLDPGIKAAYEALHAAHSDLSLSDFVNEACRFYLNYQGEPALGPMTSHLATIKQQLTALLDQERTARRMTQGVAPTIAQGVIDALTPMLEDMSKRLREATTPPAPPKPWWRFW